MGKSITVVRPSNVGKSVTTDSLRRSLQQVAYWMPDTRPAGKPGKKGVKYVRNQRTKKACAKRIPVDVIKSMEEMIQGIFAISIPNRKTPGEGARPMSPKVKSDPHIGKVTVAG